MFPIFLHNTKIKYAEKQYIVTGIALRTKKEFPNIAVINQINQESIGGFEKYPKEISFDQSQYCASSPYKLKEVMDIATIFNKRKKTQR